MRIGKIAKSVAVIASLALLGVGLNATVAQAAPITINLYEAIGYAPAEIAAFNASQSTYKVVDVGGSTGPLLAKVAAEAISDFGVSSTLSNVAHFSVATYQLYQGINSIPVQFPVSAATSLTLLTLVILAILAQNRALRGRSFRTLGGRTRPATRLKLSRLGQFLSSGWIIGILVITLGIPIFGAISASMLEGLGSLLSHYSINFSNYTRVLGSRFLRKPLIYSTEMSLITATLAVGLAAVASKVLTSAKPSRSKRFMDFFLLAAVALPGIVFAIGYIFTYNLKFINDLGLHVYGTSFLLALAYTANALPSTSRSLVGNMSQIQDSMMDASRVHGSGPARAWLDVTMPIIARPLLIAWLLTFSGTLLELPVSELLYPPGSPPVAVGIELSLAGFDFGGGTAIAQSLGRAFMFRQRNAI